MGRGFGVRFVLARRASSLLVRHLRVAADGDRGSRAADKENPFGPGCRRAFLSQSAGSRRRVRLRRQPLRRQVGICLGQRFFTGGIQNLRHDHGRGERALLGSDRRDLEGLGTRGVLARGKVLSLRQRDPLRETGAEADAADMARRVERRNSRQSWSTGLADDGHPVRTFEQSPRCKSEERSVQRLLRQCRP